MPTSATGLLQCITYPLDRSPGLTLTALLLKGNPMRPLQLIGTGEWYTWLIL